MTYASRTRRTTPYDARMFAVADKLFDDYDALSVEQVFRAIASARTRLRDQGLRLPSPEDVGALARADLNRSTCAAQAGARKTTGATPTPGS
jgi:hypothetical protein